MSDRNPVELLADEFASRYREGERPSVAEYAKKYPEHAEEIEELFPSIVMMEQLKERQESDVESVQRSSRFAGKRLERLGDYEVIQEIGRGGMGVVFEAVQTSLGRRVALKVLSDSTMASEKHVKRFEREARAAAALHHTNIVPVFGVGHEDDLHFYVMQFIEGVGLDEVLAALRLYAAEHEGDDRSDSAVVLARALCHGSFARPRKLGSSSSMSLARGSQDSATISRPLGANTLASSATRTSVGMALTGSAPGSSLTGSAPPASSPGGSGIGPVAENRDPAGGSPTETSQGDLDVGESSQAFGDQYFKSIARIGLQAADALQYAHAQHVLHRDIKPGNLLLDAQGTVWVTDFGLAKVTEQQDLTKTGDIVGTLRYMAPEQFDGKSDGRSDIYSLGLTLYELLTLQPAFDDTAIKQLVNHRSSDRLARPRAINRAIPADLETIVLKAIMADPEHRYAGAEALAEDLQRFLDDRPILARRTTAPERLWRWSRRNPALAALSGTAIALGLTVLGLLSFGYYQEKIARLEVTALKDEADRNLEQAKSFLDYMVDNIGSRGRPQLFDLNSDEEVGDVDEEYWELPPNKADADMLRRAVEFYADLADTAGRDESHARALQSFGKVQRGLQQHEEAVDAYLESLQLYRGLAIDDPSELSHVVGQAEVLNSLASTKRLAGEIAASRDYQQRALDLLEKHQQLNSDERLRFALALTYLQRVPRISGFWSQRGRPRPGGSAQSPLAPRSPGRGPGGRGGGSGNRDRQSRGQSWSDALSKAGHLLRQLMAEDGENANYRFALARCYQGQVRIGQPGSGDSPCAEAVALLERLIEEDDDPRYRFELAETLTLACALEDYQGDRLAQVSKAREVAQRLVQQYPTEAVYQSLLSNCYAQAAKLLSQKGSLAEAAQQYGEATQLKTSLVSRYPSVVVPYKLELYFLAWEHENFLAKNGALERAAEIAPMVAELQVELQDWRERRRRSRGRP